MIMQVLHARTAKDRYHPTWHDSPRQATLSVPERMQRATFYWITRTPVRSGVKQQIIDMAMNASGIRDTARVLHVSPTTVIKNTEKKRAELQPVNHAVLRS